MAHMNISPFLLYYRITRWLAYAGVLSLFAAMSVTIVDIVLRAASRTVNVVASDIGIEPVGWAVEGVVEIVQLFVMGVAFSALPFAFMRDGHVSVDLLTSRLKVRLQSMFKSISALIALWFMILIFKHGWAQMLNQIEYGDVSMTLAIPYSWFWTPLLAGVAMSIGATALLSVSHFIFAVSGKGGDVLSPSDLAVRE